MDREDESSHSQGIGETHFHNPPASIIDEMIVVLGGRVKFGRRACHCERGEIRKARRLEQEEQLGVLDLTLNAIAL